MEAFAKGQGFIRRGGFCEGVRVYSSWRLLRKGTGLFVVEAFAKGHDFSRAVKGRQFRGLQPLNRVPAAAQLPDSRGALCAPAGGRSPPLRCCAAGAQLCPRHDEFAFEEMGIENRRAAKGPGSQKAKIVFGEVSGRI